jgi:hypothetical protein
MHPLYTSKDDLIKFITSFNGAGEVVLTTCTEVVMRKSDVATKRITNPFKNVLKIQAVRVLLNTDYEGRVQQQRRIEGKQDDFQAEGLKWGECKDNVVVEHKGGQYVKTVEIGKVDKPVYLADGQSISYDDIKPFLPVPTPSAKQAVGEEVKVRTFKIDNIVSLEVGDQLVYEKQA